MTTVADSNISGTAREVRMLNLLCLLAAAGLFAFIAYNLFAAGSILSTDGLFFTVVPLMLALCFLAVPAFEILNRQLEKRKVRSGAAPATIASGSKAGPVLQAARATLLKDARGRTLPPDVSRMVAQMNAPSRKEE